MPRFFLKLAYNGAAYHGWQQQKNAHTVQAELNEKITLLAGERIQLTGCGRTDAGVHARAFFAHFDVSQETAIRIDTANFVQRLNGFLPKDIAVFYHQRVSDDFHARFSAISRTYRYYIMRRKDPFLQGLSYWYPVDLNVNEMQLAANSLLDYKDFTSFAKLHTQTKTNHCSISFAQWEEKENVLVFTLTADRFLRNMVRAIVGTLLEIGRGRLKREAIKEIIEAKDRSKAGYSVPAQGLFLENIVYPSEI